MLAPGGKVIYIVRFQLCENKWKSNLNTCNLTVTLQSCKNAFTNFWPLGGSAVSFKQKKLAYYHLLKFVISHLFTHPALAFICICVCVRLMSVSPVFTLPLVWSPPAPEESIWLFSCYFCASPNFVSVQCISIKAFSFTTAACCGWKLHRWDPREWTQTIKLRPKKKRNNELKDATKLRRDEGSFRAGWSFALGFTYTTHTNIKTLTVTALKPGSSIRNLLPLQGSMEGQWENVVACHLTITKSHI